VVVWNYDFKSQHLVTLNFNLVANNQIDVSAKPVIYLYLEKKITATLDLDYIGALTFTYPQLKEEWKVNVALLFCKVNKSWWYIYRNKPHFKLSKSSR
jgi:hypothetical protein